MDIDKLCRYLGQILPCHPRFDVMPESESDDHTAICAAIQSAIMLAEEQQNTLVAALLAQALDAAHCSSDIMDPATGG